MSPAVKSGPPPPQAEGVAEGVVESAAESARDACRRHGRMARAWVLGPDRRGRHRASSNLWLVLTFVRQLFATLGMV